MYSQDKRDAFKLRLDSGVSVPQASYAEGISSSTGYRWKLEFKLKDALARQEELEVNYQKLQVQCEDGKVVNTLLRRDNNALVEANSKLHKENGALEAENSKLRSRAWIGAVLRWLASATGAALLGNVLEVAWDALMAKIK